MKATRKFYAKYDFMTSENNPGHGFSNSESPAVFFSKKERDEYVESRDWFDFSCKAITRPEALKMADSFYNEGKYIMYQPNEEVEAKMVFI